MAILLMLGWWYGRGWLWVARGIEKHLTRISKVFAVKMLLKTWFAPWKQIYSPSTFRTFFTSLIDNTVSRFIGAVIRGGILVCALLLAALTVFLGLIALILWPLLPLGMVLLPILALSGVAL